VTQVSLEELAKSAATCDRCELCRSRANVVFGEGDPETPMLLIGEGPGETEDATGRPFVGRAGALLDKALLENKIQRKHVYITNIIKCRATLVENGRVQNRPPRVDEINACRDWLLQQIGLIKPLVIVCIGGPSAKLLIHPTFAMTREHGVFFDTPYCPGGITAVLHPAYILRMQGNAFEQNYRYLVDDIAKARRRVIDIRKGTVQPPPAAKPEPPEELTLF
jgi:uracil-DNA glycosylase family 4